MSKALNWECWEGNILHKYPDIEYVIFVGPFLRKRYNKKWAKTWAYFYARYSNEEWQ